MRVNDEWPNVPELVQTMFDAQNGKCGYCGTSKMFIRSKVSKQYFISNRRFAATFEHVTPDSHGGKYELENGVCVCDECNSLRKNMPLEEFFENFDELRQIMRDKPLRVAAKRKLNCRKNGYMIAWFAMQTGQTVDDIFLTYTPDNSYDIARKSL